MKSTNKGSKLVSSKPMPPIPEPIKNDDGFYGPGAPVKDQKRDYGKKGGG
jgi:hypothetical protein